jgi:hypothetical protein
MKAKMTAILVLALACAGVDPLGGVAAFAPRAALAQTDDLSAAQTLYDQGSYEQAMQTLRDGLASGRITGGQVVAARELTARCQAKLGDAAGARRTFLLILRSDPQYRPDPLRVPPDEMQVYDAARREFDAEQERAGQRLPASIELHWGIGSGANEEFGEYVASGGGDSEYENDPHFGGGVRFPLAPRWSLDIQIERFRATNADSFPENNGARYEITALPVAVSVAYLLLDHPRYRVSAFAGGGPMLEASSSVSFPFFTIDLQIADDKVGTYLHGGLEGEYLFHRRFAVTGRALFRSAKATGLFKDTDFDFYGEGQNIADRDIDFSGFAANIGLRAYVGY